MFNKSFLAAICLIAAFYIQANHGVAISVQTRGLLTNFENTIKSLVSKVQTQISRGITTLKSFTTMVASIQQQMTAASVKAANSTFWDFFSMFYNSTSGPITLFKNLTTAILANGQNYTNYFIVQGQNFTNCLNVSQIKSFRNAVIKNVTNCVQAQANTTLKLINSQISSLFNLSSTGFNYTAAVMKCMQTPLKIPSCLSNIVNNVTNYVAGLPQNITNLIQNDLNTITKMGFNMTLCGTNMSLNIIKNVATVGVNHMGCVYKLVAGKFNSTTSGSNSTTTTTTASPTTVAVNVNATVASANTTTTTTTAATTTAASGNVTFIALTT